MKRFPAYSLVLTLVLGLMLASCGRKERVIPKEKMSEIYAEMYVLDQWLDDNRSLRREADTSLVYAPILEKYGYTYDDYLNSVNAYMKDPTRYSRILRRTSEILNGRLSELKAEKKAREEALKESRRLDSLRNLVRLNVDSLMRGMSRTNPSDSVTVAWDSLNCLVFRFVQATDTTYDGPAMTIRTDSADVAADSLAVVSDSIRLAPADSSWAVPPAGIKTALPDSPAAPATQLKLVGEPRLVTGDLQAPESQPRRRRLLPARDSLTR